MPQSKRLLVANRGEIAIRIFSTARELGLHIVAIYTDGDESHTRHAHEAVKLPNVSSFLDVDYLVSLCKKLKIDLVHPGYGFLSESAEFCEQLTSAGVVFVGPSPDILRKTGDKLSARKLAEACGVPVLPALKNPNDRVESILEFAKSSGWPIMLKAVDGGGGRGIRLVIREEDLESSFERALSESPSRKVFAEKAAIGGFRHVEVQILGDGKVVRHYWERECSIQRRFQKVIEIAPSTIKDRKLIASVIESALRMAKSINYCYLGTWEFLVSPEDSAFYFMEINPRLQVEHTITETICDADLVRHQLSIGLGQTLDQLNIPLPSATEPPPPSTAIQLRLTAEDSRHNFSLSIGRINGATFPSGNGTRMDTHVRAGVIVSADFDSLLAKIIVSSSGWSTVVDKASRALDDTSIEGITTNLDLLRGIVLSEDFRQGNCDTQWLEKNLQSILEFGSQTHVSLYRPTLTTSSASSTPAKPATASSVAIKKGDAFDLKLMGPGVSQPFENTMRVTKVMRNDFPSALTVELSPASASEGSKQSTQQYTLELSQSSAIANMTTGRRGDPNNPSHLICPLAGQLVELLVDEGDVVDEWEPVAIIRQMKMELEVRAHKRGVVKSLWEVEEGDDVGSGMLVCEIHPKDRIKEKL